MNINSLLKISDGVPYSGINLSTEESIVLYNSLLVLQKENHFRNIFFWGKIFGTTHDYYIAYGYARDILLGQVYYYSINCTDWGLLPPATQNAKILAQLATSRFQGDPSLVIDILCDKDDPLTNKFFGEINVVKKLKEEDRLTATVDMINEEVWLVPRGGLFKRHDGVVIENLSFEGLSELDAREKKSYLHFREPRERWNVNLLTRKDYNYALDFLDTINHDIPEKCWTIHMCEGIHVIVKSLHWPGFILYHTLNTPFYGCGYFGFGKRNIDISFMV